MCNPNVNLEHTSEFKTQLGEHVGKLQWILDILGKIYTLRKLLI
jgi:hypothetical protein